MRKSIKRNYFFNLMNQLLIIIIPFITIPYLSRTLKADGVGTYSYIHSIVSYFTLFAILGVTTYGQREISYVQNDIFQRSKVFWETKLFQIATSVVALLAYIGFSFFQQSKILYLVFSFNILAVLADVSWLFYGLEEFGKIVIRNAVFKLANLAFIFLFVKTKDDVLVYCFGMCFFEFISNISLWGYVPKYVKHISVRELRPFANIKAILSMFIPTIAIQIYTVLDKTMIGIISKSAFENGYYEQAIRVSKIVLTLVTALGTVMIPRIGALFSEGDYEGVETAMYRGYRFVWFLGIPLCLGLIGISVNFVPWFYGEGFDKVVPLLRILSFLILAIGINNVTGMQYLIPTRRQNLFTVTVIIGAIVNFLLNLLLIWKYKSLGAAVASVSAETAIAIVQLVIVRNEISWKRVVCSSGKYLVAGILMLVPVSILADRLTPSFLHTFLISALGAMIYALALVILRDSFFLENCRHVIDRVISRIKQ